MNFLVCFLLVVATVAVLQVRHFPNTFHVGLENLMEGEYKKIKRKILESSSLFFLNRPNMQTANINGNCLIKFMMEFLLPKSPQVQVGAKIQKPKMDINN